MFFFHLKRVSKKSQPRGEKLRVMLTMVGCMALTSHCVRRVANQPGPDSDTLITGGKETSSFPAVVQLKTPAGTTCTGTFISDQILLTAAHCFKSEGDKATIGNVNSLKIRIHPDYSHSETNKIPITESAFDIALVSFPPKTGKATLPFAKKASKRGEKVVLVGYGSTKSSTVQTSSTKRTGTSELKDNVRGVLIISGSSGSANRAPNVSSPTIVPKSNEKDAKSPINSSVGPGDSGGPLLSADGSQILGVTSSVAASDGPLSFAMFADIGSASSQAFFRKAAAEGMFPKEELLPSDDAPAATPKQESPKVEAQTSQPAPSDSPVNSALPPPPEEVVRSLKALGASRVYTVSWNCRDMMDKPWFLGASVIYADRKDHFLWTCNLENPMQFVVRGDCDKGLDTSLEILRCL
jgi:hypothetical protein